jgi:DegV family protein with EDD domain
MIFFIGFHFSIKVNLFMEWGRINCLPEAGKSTEPRRKRNIDFYLWRKGMKILTDSAADLTQEDVDKYGIRVAPLTINFPEGQVSSEKIAADDFYNRLRSMWPEIPTTSQPSSGTFSQLYQEISGDDREILSVHISSGLSGTLESARLGAKAFDGSGVTHVDTLTLSGGERYQVLAAALAVKANWGKKAILERLDRIRSATEVIFTLETLEYLARGGRIGRVQALAGSLLKIKPIIHVDKKDGKYSSAGRGRTISQALEAISSHLLKTYAASGPLWVTVMHGQFSEQADALGELLRRNLNVARFETLRVSPVLGVHTGPGVVGTAVVPISMMEGLE